MTHTSIALGLTLAAGVLWIAPPAFGDLSSASYTVRGGHVSAGGTSSASASFSNTAALGQSEPVGPSGSEVDLASIVPGFPPLLAGALPSLDLDGDGEAYFLDSDDDGDGLDDVVETNTAVFASPSDTGTDSLIVDSDGDGIGDGVEVTANTDPNDPFSLPELVPLLGAIGQLALALLVGFTTVRVLRTRRLVRR